MAVKKLTKPRTKPRLLFWSSNTQLRTARNFSFTQNPNDINQEFKSAITFLVGEREDAADLCRELNQLLGRTEFVIASDVPNEDAPEEGARVLQIYADELTDAEIEKLNLENEFVIV